MADGDSQLYLGTVIWFRSLEFMSLGYDYDMVLLPPRSSFDAESTHARLGAEDARATTLAALAEGGKDGKVLIPQQGVITTPQSPPAPPTGR
jgi:hypothetical protein